jgi:hypothetical protein
MYIYVDLLYDYVLSETLTGRAFHHRDGVTLKIINVIKDNGHPTVDSDK